MRRKPIRRPEPPPPGMMFGPKGLVPIEEVERAARIVMFGFDKQHWSNDPSYNWAEQVKEKRNDNSSKP